MLNTSVMTVLPITAPPMLVVQQSSVLDISHLAITGYGDVSYTSRPNMNDDKSNDIQNNVVARFIPIFLFQMSEKIHIEAEFEFITNGETEL